MLWSWLRPATLGWGVWVCVCVCALSDCTPPLLAGVGGLGVCAWAPVSAAHSHSWLGCWGVCVFVCALRLYPTTPGWGVWCGCVCLGSGSGCAPPLLAGVLGSLCVCVPALLVPRHSLLGCAVLGCVFGLGFRLRPATPGWGVWGVCVFVCALRLYPATPGRGVRRGCVCSGSGFCCAPPLLAWVLGCLCVCVPAPLVPRQSWLGYVVMVCVLVLGFRLRPATPGWGFWGVYVFVCVLRLYPATPGWAVRRACVCFGSGIGCAPPLLAGVLGSVRVRVRAPLVPRHFWLGCVAWVCVLGLGSRPRPASPRWGFGVCVCMCGRSSCTPAGPGWGVWCGCVCLGLGFGCAPPFLAGVFRLCVLVCPLRLYPATPAWGVRRGCVFGLGFRLRPANPGLGVRVVCARVRAPLVPRHSWLGCAAWVCVLGIGFRLRPATPGWGVGVCLCSCARSACTPPLLAGVFGVGVCAWAWFRLRPATPGWGVWVCVCSFALSACSPPLLAGVCGACVCVLARVSAAPRHSWLGCSGVCVLLCPLCLYPATPGWGVRRGRVC